MPATNDAPSRPRPRLKWVMVQIFDPESATRVLLQVVREKFWHDNIKQCAASLSYSTLASLVPIFAIMISVLSGPAFEAKRENYLNYAISHIILQPDTMFFDIDNPENEVLARKQEEMKDSFEATIKPLAEKAGAVGIFGFLVLLVTVGLLFTAIENAFNAIWRAETKRGFFMRVAIATSLMFWGPVALALSVSLGEYLSNLPFVGTYMIPGIFSTLAFAAFYKIMPNAKVDFHSALVGGIAAAIFWEIAKLLFLLYISRVVGYYKIYGSLGLIPMLFLWVYINWMILLYGAELAYVMQHRNAMIEQWRDRKRQEKLHAELALNPAPVAPALVLAAAIEVARRFKEKCPGGVRTSQLAQSLHIETSEAQHAADQLVSAGVLARIASGEDSQSDPAYLPSCEPKACVVSALLAVAFNGKSMLGEGPSVEIARRLLAAASSGNTQRFTTLTLADLADENNLLNSGASA
jgi:membrane protein